MNRSPALAPVSRVAVLLAAGVAAFGVAFAHAQVPPAAPTTPAPAVEDVTDAVAPTFGGEAIAPFVADYEAWYHGKSAGSARMQVVRQGGPRWRVDLGITATRGVVGALGLNVQQSTVFDVEGDRYRPISQSQVRKGLFAGHKSVGTYDWSARTARWTGDVKPKHKAPVPLQDGDMSGLLINLAIMRDARPGARLQYRFVEGGRVRDYQYQVAEATEVVSIGELSYATLRVTRTNGGNDEMIVWVANGVPTPIRILQREDGEDAVDLRLVRYQGTR